MTLETDIIQPVKDFVRDSRFLLNRCTKPDRKGKRFFNPTICRIHSDCNCFCCWICRYGTGGLFCQADPHSYQQHSYWCLSIWGWRNWCQLYFWQNSLYNWTFICFLLYTRFSCLAFVFVFEFSPPLTLDPFASRWFAFPTLVSVLGIECNTFQTIIPLWSVLARFVLY